MSFYNNDDNQNQPVLLPDDYQESSYESSAPAAERLIFLLFLLGALIIAAVYNADSLKFMADMPVRAYRNYVFQHTKEFIKDYQFRQALPGQYVYAGRETAEIDPRATHVSVYYVNNEKYAMPEYEQECTIDDLERTQDGAFQMQLTIPKQAWQIIIYFTYMPAEGEIKGDYPRSRGIATNNKLIYFGDVVHKGRLIEDKPQYNYLRTMKTYDAAGKEKSTFAVGDKIHIKIIDYSNMFPNGLGRTQFIADGTFSVYSQNPSVVSRKPSKAAEEVVIFDAVGKGDAEYLYVDDFCMMNNWCRVTVKDKPKNK